MVYICKTNKTIIGITLKKEEYDYGIISNNRCSLFWIIV